MNVRRAREGVRVVVLAEEGKRARVGAGRRRREVRSLEAMGAGAGAVVVCAGGVDGWESLCEVRGSRFGRES